MGSVTSPSLSFASTLPVANQLSILTLQFETPKQAHNIVWWQTTYSKGLFIWKKKERKKLLYGLPVGCSPEAGNRWATQNFPGL